MENKKNYHVKNKKGAHEAVSTGKLQRSWLDGLIKPSDTIVDVKRGVQYPAIMLNDKKQAPGIELQQTESGEGFSRPEEDTLPEDDNSGLY